MLKNFTVVVRQIRDSGIKYKYKKVGKKYVKQNKNGRTVRNGFVNHVNYLSDSSRQAHLNTDIHILLNNAPNILNAVNKRKEYRSLNGLRGGGVANVATSFCLSLDSSFEPDEEKWKEVLNRVIKDIALASGKTESIIKHHTHAVLHNESRNVNKHTHIHVLVSNVIDLQVVKSISQKKTLIGVKKGFNDSVKRLWGVDYRTFKPKAEGAPNKPLWLARQEKLINNINKEKKIKEEITLLTERKRDLKLQYEKLIQQLKKVRKILGNWSKSYLQRIYEEAELLSFKAKDEIDALEVISPVTANHIDSLVSDIEERVPNAPESTKVSRKRRRRKQS